MTTEPSNRFVEVALKRANEALRGAGILLKERAISTGRCPGHITACSMLPKLCSTQKESRQEAMPVSGLCLVNTLSNLA